MTDEIREVLGCMADFIHHIIQVVEAMCELMCTMAELDQLSRELASYSVVFTLLQSAIREFPRIEEITEVRNGCFVESQRREGTQLEFGTCNFAAL